MSLLPFRRRSDPWRTGAFTPPWDASRPSIHAHLAAIVERDDDPNGVDLPDEARISDGSPVRYVPGMLDNVVVDGGGPVDAVHDALREVLRAPGASNIATLCDLVIEHRTLRVIDPLVERIASYPPDMDRFAAFFEWLARCGPDREPVKLAIAMLGLIEGDRYRDLFRTFGGHEEFTKFAVVALSNSLPDDVARREMERLARALNGWGRVDLVCRLAPDGDEAFRHWLVREGFRNEIMDEYLAWTAAVHGHLLEQLRAERAGEDQELLLGAADIIHALVLGGPAESMRDYDDGARSVGLWLDLVEPTTPELTFVETARSLVVAGERPAENGWSEPEACAIRERASAYLARPDVRELVASMLATGDDDTFRRAAHVAKALGLDPWTHAFDRQEADASADQWYQLMRTDDAERVNAVIALAERQLPLDRIASGAADEIGLGPEWSAHGALDWILQDLGPFPGRGWSLIAAGLRSPVVRNRNMALNALEAWGAANWPDKARTALRHARSVEPNDDVRERIDALLGIAKA